MIVEPRLSSTSIQRLSFVLRHHDGESTEYESSEYETNSNAVRSSGRYISVRNRQHITYVQSDYSSDAEQSDTYSDSAYRHNRAQSRSPVIMEEVNSPFEILDALDALDDSS